MRFRNAWRRAGRVVRWVVPPSLCIGWLLRFLEILRWDAVPAFGPIEMHLAERQTLIWEQAALGLVLAAFWAAIWVFVPDPKPRQTPAGSHSKRRHPAVKSTP